MTPNHQIEFAPSLQLNTDRYYKKYNDICLSENNTLFEVIRPYTKKKPYMDLDGQLDINISKDEFYNLDKKICDALKKKNRAVRSSSLYNYINPKGNGIPKNKLSYHIIFKNEVIENTLKCKEYIRQVKMPEITNDLKNICGSEEDHITQYLSGDEKEVGVAPPFDALSNKKPKQKKASSGGATQSIKVSSGDATPISPEDNRIKVFLKYLDNPRVDYTEIYLKIGSALAHNGAKYKTFEDWSKSINIPNRTESDYDAWRSWERQSKKIPFAIAENVLKRENPEAYKKYMKEIYDIDLILNNEDFKKGTEAVAFKIHTVIKNDIIYHEASRPHKWFVWDKKTGLWDNHINVCFKISTILTKAIEFQEKDIEKQLDNEDNEDKKKKLQEQLNNIIKRYSWKDNHLSSIIKHLQPLLEDKIFHHKLNINLGYLAFKNGLYDIENNILRDYKYDDFVSKTLPFDYTDKRNEDDQEFIMDTIMKICNNNKTHLDFYFFAIAAAILGYANRLQEFYVLYGAQGSNGKSMVFEALCNILHHYCKKSNNDLLDTDNKQIHKSLAELKNARIVWINELPKKKKLNAELVKNIRDGTKLRYRVMYGTEDSLDVTFKLFCMTNHEPKFDADGGMDRSFKQMTFNSHFHSKYEEDDFEKLQFKPSNTIHEDLQQRKMELLHILFDYAREYLRSGKVQPFPTEWEEDTKEVIEDNDRFKQFYEERMVKENDSKISWKDVCMSYFGRTDGGKKKWIRKQMKRMGCMWRRDLYFGSTKSIDKGGWVGFKIEDTSLPSFLFDMGDIEEGEVV